MVWNKIKDVFATPTEQSALEGVRAGKAAVITFTLLLLFTQAIVIGVLLLANVGAALAQGDPMAVTANVVLFGSLLGLMIAAIRALMNVRHYHEDVLGEQSDPWNQPNP